MHRNWLSGAFWLALVVGPPLALAQPSKAGATTPGVRPPGIDEQMIQAADAYFEHVLARQGGPPIDTHSEAVRPGARNLADELEDELGVEPTGPVKFATFSEKD